VGGGGGADHRCIGIFVIHTFYLYVYCVFGLSVFIDDHHNKYPQAAHGPRVSGVRPMAKSIIVEEQPVSSKNIMEATAA
jgi:hypothetical protein